MFPQRKGVFKTRKYNWNYWREKKKNNCYTQQFQIRRWNEGRNFWKQNHDNNFYIIIGFGINVKKPSVKIQGKYAYLSDINKEVIIDKLFDELIRNFNKIINKWDYGNNFEEFRNYWMKLSSDIGEQVTVVDQKTNKSGIFEYIDESGNLILRIENDLIKINTGDVFLN